ncbi:MULTISPECIES: hypothetical protein [Micromonospora]|uniref:Uncharacterized protein n=1 Tax=Micromonospora yangpuensis TaxID=683228 RepID=A0A1C6TZY9_9ACTN|nr:hypothetical protein [Micromonospora yangpuensis]GGM21576.1 hypothetical protein GCM10012279_44940 [Micromonospora yangpuensis]SCL47317.1 hypothetical protein GA0070617_0542 [Micromonospora yangpuensis]
MATRENQSQGHYPPPVMWMLAGVTAMFSMVMVLFAMVSKTDQGLLLTVGLVGLAVVLVGVPYGRRRGRM